MEWHYIGPGKPMRKGCVERANQTLQDRLVKELRLRRIDDIESANAFLPAFIADYNQRFSVAPKTSQNAHRKLLHDSAALDLILSLHTPRKLSRNLTCRYRSREYQIQGQGHGYRLRGSTVTVCESFDGPISLLCQGKTLDYRVLAQGQTPIPTDDEKSLCRTVDKARSLQRKRPQATNPPQTTPGTAGLASTQPLPPLPHDRPPRPALAGRVKTPTSGYERPSVIPAKARIQGSWRGATRCFPAPPRLDSRFRGNDVFGGRCLSQIEF